MTSWRSGRRRTRAAEAGSQTIGATATRGLVARPSGCGPAVERRLPVSPGGWLRSDAGGRPRTAALRARTVAWLEPREAPVPPARTLPASEPRLRFAHAQHPRRRGTNHLVPDRRPVAQRQAGAEPKLACALVDVVGGGHVVH